MKISEIKPGQGKIDISGEITDKSGIREFTKFGKSGRVANATIKDESGSISLTLWNDDIEKVNEGDIVKIENGYANEWQGQVQLSTGKFGKLEIVSKSENASPPEKASKKPKEEEEKPEDTEEEEFGEEDL
ncbi:MAG: SOSS complex subunit B family protein [Candidatus Woesearchaeota archaeon]|nr:SOSS complex subunit B family protein [Candidatus Woesearchaeota archaeon]